MSKAGKKIKNVPTPPKEPAAPKETVTIGKPSTHRASFYGMNFGWNATPGIANISTSAYRSPYANMGIGSGMCNDVPAYFAMMNENNGGILYWPVTLKEKYEWYRYFARTDPYVKQAIEYNTDLPMSKIVLRMPKMRDEKRRAGILAKYQAMVRRTHLFDRLHSILFEMNVIGNAFVFCDFDEERKEWGSLRIIPPEEVIVSKYPMSDVAKIQYQPEIENAVIRKYSVPVDTPEAYEAFLTTLKDDDARIFAGIPYEYAKQLVEHSGVIMMDTDPFSGDHGHKVGSFVYHFAEKRHDYYDLGVSPLECVLISLLQKEHLKHTQLSLLSRNMTPRNKVTAPDITSRQLEELREEIDKSMLSPDYTICTNFDFSWEQIGADNRLINLSSENEAIENQLCVGLGLNKEILMGEGMYSGSKLSVELMNTKYLFKREQLSSFVEESLFLPMAEENGFYEMDDYGNKIYYYPKLSFTRLSIRDNSEVFDSLFQLYQKGSIPIDVILELFNLDSDEIHEKLRADMFTVKDATYNEMLRGMYTQIGDAIIQETDLTQQMMDYVTGPEGKRLTRKPKQEEEDGGEGDEFGGYEAAAEKPQERAEFRPEQGREAADAPAPEKPVAQPESSSEGTEARPRAEAPAAPADTVEELLSPASEVEEIV